MGLAEDILARVSVRGALLFVVGAYILFAVCMRIDEYIRLRRIGPSAPSVPCKVPFGLDVCYRQVKALNNNTTLQEWLRNFRLCGSWTVETRIFGRRIIFTADPDNVKAILAAQFNDYGKGEPFHEEWRDFLGDSIFTTDGSLWHNSRQMIRPQFVKDRVSDLQCFERHSQILFRAMANGGALEGEDQPVDLAAVNGRVIEISDLFFRYTLDCATEFLFGKDVKSLSTPRQSFAEAFAEVQRVQSVFARAGPLRGLVPRKTFDAGLKVINDFVNQYVERALRLPPEELASKAKSDHGYTFLHELASHTRDRRVLRDQLVAVLLAGRDTTAATLSWCVYELARHPACVTRLREEVLRVVGGGRSPTYDDLKAMRYLQAVMSETLRLYPAVPFNVRLALRDCTLPRGGGPDGTGPLAVLKDTPVTYSTLAMQRREDLYPAPSESFAPADEFSPERWGAGWQPRPWQYVPFNGGPRICVGQQFALTEMGYVLTRMFQRFERVTSYMAEVDGGSPTLRADVVLVPADGVRVVFWEAKGE